MARKKKKRKSARKAHGNPKRAAVRKKKRRHVSSPTKRRASARRRRAHANPKRRHVRRAHARRRAHSNPKRHRAKRRHRRNPGLPVWASALIAAGLATATFAVVHVAATGITQRTDPTLGTLMRNRNILAGAALIGGTYLAATKSPVFGAAVASAGLVAAIGTPAVVQLSNLLPAPTASKMAAVYGQDMRAVYDQMSGYEEVAGLIPMQAVYGQDMRGIGDFLPSPPWQGSSPF